jgi:hypothetical protein
LILTFLIELNTQVKDNGGALDQEQADAVRIEYRALLMEGEVECPPPDEDKEERKGKRGPIKVRCLPSIADPDL